jgi:trehalose 6-phosphate phosphatase
MTKTPNRRTPYRLPIDRAALFVDLDGTIVPVIENPAKAKASGPCRVVLKRARDLLCGRLAILSGHPLKSVDAVLGGAIGCAVGLLGRERRTPCGEVQSCPPYTRVGEAAGVLDTLVRARPGLRMASGPASVTIDYSAALGAEEAVLEAVDSLAKRKGLVVVQGDRSVKLSARKPDKGSALAWFMYEAPFRGSVPLCLGDGETDEPAFVEAARRGGAGILVGRERKTRAAGRLRDRVAALSWIMRSLDRGHFDLMETGARLP